MEQFPSHLFHRSLIDAAEFTSQYLLRTYYLWDGTTRDTRADISKVFDAICASAWVDTECPVQSTHG